MKKKLYKTAWLILKETIEKFNNDKVAKLSASLAYYSIFSLAPMFFIIISLLGFFWGKEAIQGEVYSRINYIVGDQAALQIQEIIKNLSLSGGNPFNIFIGIVFLLVGATGIFTEIQDSINMIWNIKAKPQRGVLKMVVNRLLSFSMVIGLGLLLMASLLVNTVLIAFSSKLIQHFPELTIYMFYVVNFMLTFVSMILLCSIIFKFLPDAKIHWADIGVGAIATSLLFVLGKLIINFYLSKSNLNSIFGAAGSLIVVLIWVYYCSIILYTGAEFTQVYSHHLGSKIIPADYAVFIEHLEIEKNEIKI